MVLFLNFVIKNILHIDLHAIRIVDLKNYVNFLINLYNSVYEMIKRGLWNCQGLFFIVLYNFLCSISNYIILGTLNSNLISILKLLSYKYLKFEFP